MPLIVKDPIVVKSRQEHQPEPAIYALSPMDIFGLQWPLTYTYIFPPPPSSPSSNDSSTTTRGYDSSVLLESLKDFLTMLPEFAGRIIPNPNFPQEHTNEQSAELYPVSHYVILNNEGALFSEATWLDETLESMFPGIYNQPTSEPAVINIPASLKLLRGQPEFFYNPARPLLKIQCTIFGCGGMSLGIIASHGVMDGEGSFTIIDQLSRFYRRRMGIHVDILEIPRVREVLIPAKKDVDGIAKFDHWEYNIASSKPNAANDKESAKEEVKEKPLVTFD
ncbi:hypothetical protein HDU76_010607, partial [Blyttiomyces sp. JEL0837]